MKRRVLLAFGGMCAAMVMAYAADNAGIEGKWATEAVRTANGPVKTNTTMEKLLKGAGEMAGQNMPGGGRGPGGRPGGGPGGGPGGVRVDTTASKVVEKGSSPDGVALTLDLKVNKSKLTGKVFEVTKAETFDIQDDASVMDKKFKFTTLTKKANVKLETVYKGELTDESTITLTRWTISGKPVDVKEDGSPETLIFKRTK